MTFSNSFADHLPYGPERRELILKGIQFRLDEGWSGLPVNNRYQMHTKHDKDLKYLLKKKKIKMIRKRSFSNIFWGSFYSQSYLILAGDNVNS